MRNEPPDELLLDEPLLEELLLELPAAARMRVRPPIYLST
jgi:hypothetical protein